MSPQAIVVYCGLLLTVTAFSVDITLPAFGLIADELEAPYSLVQLIVPLFILATGVGQIIVGPFSDRFGRKPVVLAGLGLYATGAVVCFMAPDIETLLAGRLLQGLGAAAGPVIGRAILRDLFTGRPLASNLALATMIFAFGPIVAPLAGVLIIEAGSWRSIFLVITLFGLALITTGWLSLPESNQSPDRSATRPGVLLNNTRTALGNPQSRFYLIMAGPIMSMMLIILVSIPRVFKESYGVEGALFAILFALHGLGIIIGQLVNRRIIAAHGPARAMKVGATVVFASACLMLGLNTLNLMGPLVLTGSMIFLATGFLVVMSNATALALDPNGSIAGFVSSFFGFCAQFSGSIIAIVAAGLIGGDVSAFILTLLVVSGSVLAMLILRDPVENSTPED